MGLAVTSHLDSLEAARRALLLLLLLLHLFAHRTWMLAVYTPDLLRVCHLLPHTHGARPINNELTVAIPCVTAEDAAAHATARDVSCVLIDIQCFLEFSFLSRGASFAFQSHSSSL